MTSAIKTDQFPTVSVDVATIVKRAATANTIQEAAQGYAASGWKVFAVQGDKAFKPENRKAPATKGGFHDAFTYTTADQVERVMKHAGGIGYVPTDGMLVLDADSPEAYAFLFDLLGEPTALTASHEDGAHAGGAHWYVRLTDGYGAINGLSKGSAKARGYDIDIIGGGNGYVVAPPTMIGGKAYRWNGTGQVYGLYDGHPATEWLRSLATPRKGGATEPRNGNTPRLDEWRTDTEWADILTRNGYTLTGADRCGCEVYKHPDGASTDRSVTAHAAGCTESNSAHPETLHAWSSTVAAKFDGDQTISKERFVTVYEYGGDFAKFRDGEGIENEPGGCSFDIAEVLADAQPFTVTDDPAVADITADELEMEARMEAAWDAGTFEEMFARIVERIADKWLRTEAQAAAAGIPTPKRYDDDGKLDKLANPWHADRFPMGATTAPDLMRAVFDYSDFTRWVFHKAREMGDSHPTGPFALLMTELIRGGVRTPTNVHPMGRVPLSTNVIRIGESGTGKSLTMTPDKWSALAGHIYPGNPYSNAFGTSTGHNWDTHRALGSGEVLAELLCDEVPVLDDNGKPIRGRHVYEQKEHSVLWVEEAEMKATTKRADKDSSTYFDALNAAWAGENPATATRTKGVIDLPNPFNVFMTGGMQPEVWFRLADQMSGFRQRTLLCDVADPWRTMPDVYIAAKPVAGFKPVALPKFPANGCTFNLCDEINAARMKAADDAAWNHTSNRVQAESHMLMVRIRLACLAALRHGTFDVTSELWEWTGHLIEHHRRVRAWMDAVAEIERQNNLVNTGKDHALTRSAATQEKCDGEERAAKYIVKYLSENGGEAAERDVKRACGRNATYYAAARDALANANVIAIIPGSRKGSKRIRLVPETVNNNK